MKFGPLAAISIMALPLTGCSVLFPDPPDDFCVEENKKLSKTEIIYRGLDHFYDDPLDKIKDETSKGARRRTIKPHPELISFANFKAEYLKVNPQSSRRKVIVEYYRKFPDCCIVNYPPIHFKHGPIKKRFFYRTNPLDANKVDSHRWVYDFVTFTQRLPGRGFSVQRQYFIDRIKAKFEGGKWPKRSWLPDRKILPVIYRGVSACGVVDVTSNGNWN